MLKRSERERERDSMHTGVVMSPTSVSNVSYHTETSSSERSNGSATRLSLPTTSGVMVAAILVSVALFVILLCFCLRRRKCWGAIPAFGRAGQVAAGEPSEPVGKGLDASAVRALPSFVFRSEESVREGPQECSVCIAELADGEAALQLPRCGHGFHLECIEAWLRSHSTCPLCRNPVAPVPPEDVSDTSAVEPVGAQFPAAASGGRSSGLPEGAVIVIELPPPTSPILPSQGPNSLRWLVMHGGRGADSARSPREYDVEHGVGAPKNPAT